MTSHEVRLTLIRQTQAIRKALYVIECNLGFYEKLVAEELREKASQAQHEASAQADQARTERES